MSQRSTNLLIKNAAITMVLLVLSLKALACDVSSISLAGLDVQQMQQEVVNLCTSRELESYARKHGEDNIYREAKDLFDASQSMDMGLLPATGAAIVARIIRRIIKKIGIKNISVSRGVARGEIDYMHSMTITDFRILKAHLYNRGARSAVIDTGDVINEGLGAKLIRKARASGDKARFLGARVEKLGNHAASGAPMFRLHFDKIMIGSLR